MSDTRNELFASVMAPHIESYSTNVAVKGTSLYEEWQEYYAQSMFMNPAEKRVRESANNRLLSNMSALRGQPLRTTKYNRFVIFGAGGTGGWFMPKFLKIVNDAILKNMINSDIEIIVVDADIVEPKNLVRQNFVEQDLNKNKAQVLVERYAPHFKEGVNISFVDRYVSTPEIINTFEKDVHNKFINIAALGFNEKTLCINLIDNVVSRALIHQTCLHARSSVIDVANNAYNGQLNFSWYEDNNYIPSSFFDLNIDHLQTPENVSVFNCADADIAPENADQLFSANDMAATVLGNYINAMFMGKAVRYACVEFVSGVNPSIKPKYPLSVVHSFAGNDIVAIFNHLGREKHKFDPANDSNTMFAEIDRVSNDESFYNLGKPFIKFIQTKGVDVAASHKVLLNFFNHGKYSQLSELLSNFLSTYVSYKKKTGAFQD